MPIRRSTFARPLVAVAMVAASSFSAIAQQPPSPTRVRGTIESVDGDVLSVKSRSGEDVKLRMTADMRVVGIIKISLSDIKLGSFVGTTRCLDLTVAKTRSKFTSFLRTCAAPARDRGLTICVPTAP
jgi:hypothetical protein